MFGRRGTSVRSGQPIKATTLNVHSISKDARQHYLSGTITDFLVSHAEMVVLVLRISTSTLGDTVKVAITTVDGGSSWTNPNIVGLWPLPLLPCIPWSR